MHRARSLYLVVISALRCRDHDYADVLGRWLAYLQAGAPGSVVLPVITCDRLLPSGARPLCARSSMPPWQRVGRRATYWHNARHRRKATPTLPGVACVSCVAGGDESLRAVRLTLEDRQLDAVAVALDWATMPRWWSHAASMFLRATGKLTWCVQCAMHQVLDAGRTDSDGRRAVRRQLHRALHRSASVRNGDRGTARVVEAVLRQCASALILARCTTLQLLVNQGEIFMSCIVTCSRRT